MTTPARPDRPSAGAWSIPIGAPLVRVAADHGLTLLLGDGPGRRWTLRIEGRCRVRTSRSGDRVRVDPEAAAAAEAAVLPLLHRTVHRAEVSAGGPLLVVFDDGDGGEIAVPPDPRYEAWELSGPGGVRLVGMPGGDVAAWGVRGYQTAEPEDPGDPGDPGDPETTYYAILDVGRTRENPIGIARRQRAGDRTVDTVFTRNLRWEPTEYFARYRLGHNDHDHVEITAAEAEALVRRTIDRLE